MPRSAYFRPEKSHLELTEDFRAFDRNADGAIDRNEFAEFVRYLDDSMDEQRIRTGFRTIDEDDNGLIGFTEFLVWWRTQ